MLIARITDLLSHTWNIPIVDKMISIWFSMRVSLLKISGSMGMFTEWLVEPKGVWNAQPGGCAGIAHTWFFETSCGIQTMQSQKLESMNPTQHHQYPWFLGPKLSCTSWTRWSFLFQACQARWVSCFSISYRWGGKRQAIGSLLTDNFYYFQTKDHRENISLVAVLIFCLEWFWTAVKFLTLFLQTLLRRCEVKINDPFCDGISICQDWSVWSAPKYRPLLAPHVKSTVYK